MMTRRGWLPLAALVAGSGALLTLSPIKPPAAHAQSTPAPDAGAYKFAVVDLQSLLKNHPEFENLKQIDEQLHDLREEKELIPILGAKGARDKFYGKMEEQVKKAKAEMEAEKAQVEAEMAGLAASLQGAMNAELKRVQGDYDGQIQALIDKYRKKNAPPPQSQPEAVAPPSTRPAAASVDQYREGLLLVRQRNLTAKKLELEKSIRSEIEAERGRFDQQMAATEDQIAGQYQEEKLNLQLKLQVTQDEAEQQKLQDRLGVISEEISSKKAARRAELEASFDAFRDGKNKEFAAQMASYTNQINSEVARQVDGWRPPERQQAPQQPKPQQPQAPMAPPKEIEEKIAQARADIKGKMAAKEAELRGAMEAKSQEARARLMAKQKEIQARLEAYQEELKELFEQSKKNLDAKSKEKMAAIDKQIEKVQKERDALYDRMVADINKVVAGVAEKKDVPMVLGQVVYNRTCEDLTDFSMVGVKQLGSR